MDDLLREIRAGLIGEHLLRACEFEFEIAPFEEAYGRGSLMYEPAAGFNVDRSRGLGNGLIFEVGRV